MSSARVEALRKVLAEQELEGLVVTNRTNVAYLSGFRGSAGALIITADQQLVVTDFRYFTQVAQQAPDFELVKAEQGQHRETLIATLKDLNLARLGFEAQAVTVDEHNAWTEEIPANTLIPTTGLVEELRQIKEEAELTAIRAAVELADQAFAHILSYLRPGVTERDLAIETEYFLKRAGAEAAAFPPIVASGPNGALPHATVSERAIQPGDLVVFDLGAMKDGYCTDLTRTVCLGKADAMQQEVYALVYRAQVAALEAACPGRTGPEVDAVARNLIAEAGYEEAFGHGLGHGVGLEVHEAPRLSSTSEDTLKAGMVVTVEPGIYLPQWGGVRIEDLVLVTEEGREVLTQAAKPSILLEV